MFFISVTAQFVRGYSPDNIVHLTYFVKWAKQGGRWKHIASSVEAVAVGDIVVVLSLPLRSLKMDSLLQTYIQNQELTTALK